MTTSSKPEKGEIWLAYIEFSDKPGVGKVRPVLILENEEEQLVVTVAKVTSVAGDDNSRIELKNWKNYGLLKPSFVRIDQRFRVSIDKILLDKPLGKLEDDLFEDIERKVKTSIR